MCVNPARCKLAVCVFPFRALHSAISSSRLDADVDSCANIANLSYQAWCGSTCRLRIHQKMLELHTHTHIDRLCVRATQLSRVRLVSCCDCCNCSSCLLYVLWHLHAAAPRLGFASALGYVAYRGAHGNSSSSSSSVSNFKSKVLADMASRTGRSPMRYAIPLLAAPCLRLRL